MNPEQNTPDNDLNKTLPNTPPMKKVRSKWFSWGFFFALLALGAVGAGGGYQYQENDTLRQALAQQKTALTQVKHIIESVLAESRLLQLTLAARVEEVEKRTQQLSTVYQDMHINEAQRLLADTQQTLTMASEALYVTHDISAALKRLQYADNKIQGISLPELVKLRMALQQDMQALSSLPQVDMAREMARIDTLVNGIDNLPLNIDIQRTVADKKQLAVADTHLPWWKQFGKNIWHELKSLVSIRRLDKPQQALLAVDQLMLLRENMKLRMVSARIALMTRNQVAYAADLQAVQKYLTTYFDQGQASTQHAADLLQKLLTVQLVTEQPIFTALEVLRNTPIAAMPKEGEQG